MTVAKYRSVDITKDDLKEFLAGKSDFAFELRVLRTLVELSWSCLHSGTYSDPVSGVSRQFDIRATAKSGRFFIQLAVECKSLQPAFPLLVCQVPRHSTESFHEILWSFRPRRSEGFITNPFPEHSVAVRLEGQKSLYWPGQYVGKSTNQVGRTEKGDLSTDDRELYEKWSQAIASSYDLIQVAGDAGLQNGDQFFLIVPIVVIPDGTLWAANYSENGDLDDEPFPTDRCSMFINKTTATAAPDHTTYTQSHLEIVTLAGLKSLISSWYRTFDAGSETRVFDITEIELKLHAMRARAQLL